MLAKDSLDRSWQLSGNTLAVAKVRTLNPLLAQYMGACRSTLLHVQFTALSNANARESKDYNLAVPVKEKLSNLSGCSGQAAAMCFVLLMLCMLCMF